MFALYDNEKQFNLYVESVAEEVRKEATAKGRAEGVTEGKEEEKIAMAKRLLKAKKFSNDEIAEYSGLSIKDIEALASA